jgi:hypothetical protein
MTMDSDPYYKVRFLGAEKTFYCVADACQQLEERVKVGGRRAAA